MAKATPDPVSAPELANRYAAGIDAGYAKMVKRVGKAEADKWRRSSIASAQMYAANCAAVRDWSRRQPGGAEPS